MTSRVLAAAGFLFSSLCGPVSAQMALPAPASNAPTSSPPAAAPAAPGGGTRGATVHASSRGAIAKGKRNRRNGASDNPNIREQARQASAGRDAQAGSSRSAERDQRYDSAAVALSNRRAQCRQRPIGAADHGKPDDGFRAGSQPARRYPARRNSGSSARPRRGCPRRRRQGQSILSARLQSRSWHRLGDLRRRHADQSADACARAGLCRPQLADARNRQQPRRAQGAVFRRCWRFRHRWLALHQSQGQRREECRRSVARQLRLPKIFHHGFDQARRRIAALCRRDEFL